jgi:APA family basic amino acid/polyamine antiporter
VAKETAARELLAHTHPELVSGTQGFLNALESIMASPSAALMARAHQLLNAPHLFGMELGFNLPAFLIAMVITTILVIGIKQSAKFNTGIVIVKVAVVLFVLGLGSFYVHPANWGHDWHSFAPMGLAGIGTAAGYIFFAYIGFDAVSTTAQEAKNPQRDLPIGIIASLTICTILYIGIAAVLTGMVPWQLVNIGAPISYAFLDHNIFWASNIITCGALAGLTSVMLVMLIGQTRVLYAMASDGLLPKKFFGAIHHKFHTPWKNTILVGLLAAGVGSLTPIDMIGKMVLMVCVSIIVLRIKAPDQPRPFHTPGIFFNGRLPVVPALGVLVNGYLMCSLGWENWARLIIWLVLGLIVYFTYSVKHSKVQKLLKSGEIN